MNEGINRLFTPIITETTTKLSAVQDSQLQLAEELDLLTSSTFPLQPSFLTQCEARYQQEINGLEITLYLNATEPEDMAETIVLLAETGKRLGQVNARISVIQNRLCKVEEILIQKFGTT